MHRQFVEISVRGDVDPASMADFDGVRVTADGGVSRLRLTVRDDSALYGVLDRLQSTGLEVLAVSPRDEVGDERSDALSVDRVADRSPVTGDDRSPELVLPSTSPPPNERCFDDELT